MALSRLVLAVFWFFCTVLLVTRTPNTQTAISRLLFVRLTPSLHHSSSVWSLRVFLCILNGFAMDLLDEFWFVWTVLFVNRTPNTQTAISWLLFVCLTPSLHHFSSVWSLRVFYALLMLWAGSFWLHFGSSVLFCVSVSLHHKYLYAFYIQSYSIFSMIAIISWWMRRLFSPGVFSYYGW